jgi:hypothetical protein
MFRTDGPFKILEKINDNTYKLEFPPEFGVSPTFKHFRFMTLLVRRI